MLSPLFFVSAIYQCVSVFAFAFAVACSFGHDLRYNNAFSKEMDVDLIIFHHAGCGGECLLPGTLADMVSGK